MMTRETMKKIDEIGVVVHNAYLCKMKTVTVAKPADEVIEAIKGLGYEVIDLVTEIKILIKK